MYSFHMMKSRASINHISYLIDDEGNNLIKHKDIMIEVVDF